VRSILWILKNNVAIVSAMMVRLHWKSFQFVRANRHILTSLPSIVTQVHFLCGLILLHLTRIASWLRLVRISCICCCRSSLSRVCKSLIILSLPLRSIFGLISQSILTAHMPMMLQVLLSRHPC
jgi:hypothetical protein